MVIFLVIYGFLFNTVSASDKLTPSTVRKLKKQCRKNLFEAHELLFLRQNTSKCLIGKKLKYKKIWLKSEKLRLEGKIKESAALLKKTVKKSKKNLPLLRLSLAKLLKLQGKLDDYAGLLDRINDDYERNFIGKNKWELLAAGEAAFLRSKWDTAGEIFEKLFTKYPDFVPGLTAAGNFYSKRSYFSRAAKLLSVAASKAPFYIPSLASFGGFLFNHPYGKNLGKGYQLIEKIIKLNPDYAPAYLEKAKIAIFDLNIEKARKILEKVKKIKGIYPRLFTLESSVLKLENKNAEYLKIEKFMRKTYPLNKNFYMETGRILNRHHRYAAASEVFKKGMLLFPQDAGLTMWYGINLLRIGKDKTGFYFIKKASELDPDNIMAGNLTMLYENKIFKNYIRVKQGHFIYHVSAEEWKILKYLLPEVMEAAFARYRKHYNFTPKTPIVLELFSEPSDFSVLIAGEPVETGILGVCFGEVIDALSPSAGKSNWAMVLSHELAHVFHIQMSKNKVVRWFTEGLAEFETSWADYRWKRESSRRLYTALKQNAIKGVLGINNSFSHASSELEMVNAYILSTWMVRYLFMRSGFGGLKTALEMYGQNKTTAEVIERITKESPKEFDKDFRRYMFNVLSVYDGQFNPDELQYVKLEDLKERAGKNPSGENYGKYALKLLFSGYYKESKSALNKGKIFNINDPYILYTEAYIALKRHKLKESLELIRKIIKSGKDGFILRYLVGYINLRLKKYDDALENYVKAHEFDPEDVEVIKKISFIQHFVKHDDEKYLNWIAKYARLREGNAVSCNKIVQLSWKFDNYDRINEFGRQLLNIQPFLLGKSALYIGRAALYGKNYSLAFKAFAVYLASGATDETGHIRYMYAESAIATGRKRIALKVLKELKHLYPSNKNIDILLKKLHR